MQTASYCVIETIGVAPGGAGGTLAPPPLKVGGPGPPTFGAGKKNQYFRHHKIVSLYGKLTLKY